MCTSHNITCIQYNDESTGYSDVAHDTTICVHNIISTAPNIMMKVQGTIIFTYAIKICAHNIISTASAIMIKAQDTMTFIYYVTI